MTGPVVIDLDVAPPPPPVRGPTGPVRRRSRLAALVLAGTAVLLGAGGAPAPARYDPPVRITGEPRTIFGLGPDAVYVAAAARTELRRYTPDGTLRWSAPVPDVSTRSVVVVDDVVLVGTEGWPGRTYAFDRLTGERRWSVPGTVVAAYGSTAVLNGRAQEDPSDTGVHVTSVSLADGRELWRHSVRPRPGQNLVRTVTETHGRYTLSGAGVVGADGSGELFDFATGERRPLSDWPATPDAEGRSGARIGSVVVVFDPAGRRVVGPAGSTAGYSRDGGSPELRAYSADTLRPVWTIEARSESWGASCGRWICVSDGTGVRALDPADGRQVWHSDSFRVLGRPAATRGVAYAPGGEGVAPRVSVVDLDNGRTLATYPGWRVVGAPDRRYVPMLRPVPDGRWEVASLDLQRLVAYPLGRFAADSVAGCQVSATRLACITRDMHIEMWKYAAT